MVFPVTSPLLDACVLAVLSRGDAYGYILTQTLRRYLDISESTLYPVLRRLQQEGALGVYDQPYQGRNRRYYTVTTVGRGMFQGYREEWQGFRDKMELLLNPPKGESKDDK